jgi:hypothetical protein
MRPISAGRDAPILRNYADALQYFHNSIRHNGDSEQVSRSLLVQIRLARCKVWYHLDPEATLLYSTYGPELGAAICNSTRFHLLLE